MKGMLYRKCKRPAAAILAAVMVLTAVNLPETSLVADAAAGWEWNADYSASYYQKIKNLSAVADSEQESGENESVKDDGSPAGSGAAAAVDGCATSYWHSYWGNDPNTPKVIFENNTLTGNNTITVTLRDAQTIVGVTYLPRQDKMVNGPWTKFKIDTQAQGSEVWTPVSGIKDTCKDVTVSAEGIFKIDYKTNDNSWNGNNNHKFEREVLFAAPVENVKKVRFTIVNSTASSYGGKPNQFLTAAEIGVLKEVSNDAEGIRITKEKLGAKIASVREMAEVYGNQKLEEKASAAEAVKDKAEATLAELQEQITVLNAIDYSTYDFTDSKGKGKFVSDLGWHSTQLPSDTDAWGAIQKDKGPNGVPIGLTSNGQTTYYKKGLGTHATTKIVYDVSDYEVFEAEVGINSTQTAANANVIFRVEISDDNNTYTEVASSEAMTPGNKAHIKAELKGAKYMKLIADENGHNGSDHSVWADAKLYHTYYPLGQYDIIAAEAGTVEEKDASHPNEGPVEFAIDNNRNTFWHSKYSGSTPDERWIQFDLGEVKPVNKIQALARQDVAGANGSIEEYEILVSKDGEKYTKVAKGNWTTSDNTKRMICFDPVDARYIKLKSVKGVGDYATLAEFDVFGPVEGQESPQFIDFLGGSLRTTPNTGDYTKANMRFGYEIATKNDAVGYKTRFEKWGFYYSIPGSTVYEVKGTNRINAPTREGFERSNLVITNIPSTAYKTNVTCGCYVTYALDNNEEVTLYSSETGQTRNVETVATHVYNSGSESEANRNYAYGILQEINKQP